MKIKANPIYLHVRRIVVSPLRADTEETRGLTPEWQRQVMACRNLNFNLNPFGGISASRDRTREYGGSYCRIRVPSPS